MEVVDAHRPPRDPHRLDIEGANRNDSILLEPTLDAAAGHGLLADIETIWLDRGYDSDVTRQRLAERDIDDAVIAKKRRRGIRRAEEGSADGAALAGRAHELVAVELRSLRRVPGYADLAVIVLH